MMAKFKLPLIGEVNIPIPIYDKIKEAERRSENTRRKYDRTQKTIIQKRKELQDTLEIFGRTKANIYDKNIRDFVAHINRIKDYDVSLKASFMKGKVIEISFKEFNTIDFDNIDMLKATLAGGGSGAITAAVAYAGIGALASASTGTAIVTLHGIAATNATLAWLGGGSIASGGLGMTAGTVILGGLIVIPALVVGGLYIDNKLDEALAKVEKDENKVNNFVKEWKIAIERMDEINHRTIKLKKVLLELDLRFYSDG